MSDKVRRKPLFSDDNADLKYYGNLSKRTRKYSNDLPRSIRRALNDLPPADGPSVAPSPAPMRDLPNEYEFEILRLRRRVNTLECTVRDRDERTVAAIAMLEDEMVFWRSYLHDHIDPTYGDIKRRVIRIESTLGRLREKGSRIYPALQTTWAKKDG